MRVRIWKLYVAGRRLPERHVDGSPSLGEGELVLASTDYRGHGKVGTLTLVDSGNQTTQGTLAVLYHPELVALAARRMRFRGIEAVEHAGYAQEWMVEIL